MRDQETNGCPLFIGGNWTGADGTATEPVFNPSDGSVIAMTPMCGASEVDAAVQAAREALPDWSATPVVDRARILFRYVHLLEQNFEELSRMVTREHGKTLEEARGSVRRGIEVVEFACGAPTLLMGDSLEQIASGIDCDTIRQPVGVCAGISPFNFPAMVPMWMYPIAIVCGNTFVLKPSEKVPLTAIRLVELLQQAGLPDGVMNLVHGGVDVVNALCTHPGIDAVSFVGSSPVARHVYQTATAHGKRVQSAGGAKNYMVIPARRGSGFHRGRPDRIGIRMRGRAVHGRQRGGGGGGSRRSRAASAARGAGRDEGRPDGPGSRGGHGAGGYPPASGQGTRIHRIGPVGRCLALPGRPGYRSAGNAGRLLPGPHDIRRRGYGNENRPRGRSSDRCCP